MNHISPTTVALVLLLAQVAELGASAVATAALILLGIALGDLDRRAAE